MVTRPLESVAILVLSALILGCQPVWNELNRHGLQVDVENLLRSSGIPNPVFVSCQMLGTSRTGRCEVVLGKGEIERVVEVLDLTRLKKGDSDSTVLLAAASKEDGGCIGSDFSELGFETWGRAWRGDSLQTSSGAAFTYVVIHYGPAESWACLQVEYAYG